MNERQRNTTAIAATIIILGLSWILLLLFSLSRPYPPPPEFGVEVSLGDSMDGMGVVSDPMQQAMAAPMPQHSSMDDFVTDNSDNVALPTQPTPRATQSTPSTPTRETPPQPQEPQINPHALFPGQRTTQGGNQGTTGNPGNQGDPTGSRDGTATSGTSGSGGGISFSLAGRQSANLATPAYNSNDQGFVVVRIWVNAQGAVIRAQAGERGTTVTDQNLWRTAEAAAMRSTFSADQNAPDQQTGTITYRFIKLN